MGAFGELLIQYWGGDMDHYRGNKKNSSVVSVIPTEEEKRLRREDSIKRLKLSDARYHLDRLENDIMYRFIDHTIITENIFRNAYKKINTEEWVIDIMWSEYSDFLKNM